MLRTKKMSLKALYGIRQDRYLTLIHDFPLRPITSERDLDAAVAVIDGLLDQPRLTKPEQDYLEVLSDLVETYETLNLPEGHVSDGEMLRSLLEWKNTTQSRLAKQTGIAESTISEVLKGKRELNRRHITKLCSFFGIEPGAFLRAEGSP